MSSKALFLLTVGLTAAPLFLPGQTIQTRKIGSGSGPVVFKMPENVEVVRDVVYASYGERTFLSIKIASRYIDMYTYL